MSMKRHWSVERDILIAPLLEVKYILSCPTSFVCNKKNYPDPNVKHHCNLRHGQKTLYNPDPNAEEDARAAEELLEKAVARYAEDNLLVVRVRKLPHFVFLLFLTWIRFS